MSQGEKMVAGVFCSAAFLWILPGLLAGIPRLAFLDVFDDTAIAIAVGIVLFQLPGRGSGEMVLNWNDAEDGLPWVFCCCSSAVLALRALWPRQGWMIGLARSSVAWAICRQSC